MLKNLFISGALLSILFSCTSPKSTAKDFLEALNTYQFETAMNLVTDESMPILFSVINQQNPNASAVNIQVKECASLDNNDKEISCIYLIYNDEGEYIAKTIHLVKQNYQWKVDLTNP